MNESANQPCSCELQVVLTLAGQLLQAGRCAEAVHYYRHAGAAFVARHDAHHALAVYRMLHELLPHCLHTAAMIAEQHRVLGDLPKAVAWYRYVAQSHQTQGRPYPAAQVYRLVLTLCPADVELRIHLAELEISMGFGHDGASQLAMAGQQLRSMGRFDRYFEIAGRLAELCPNDPVLLRELVRMHLLHGSAHRAVTWLRRLLRIEPEDLEARRLMAECFAARGQFDLAAAAAHRAARRMTDAGPEHLGTAVRLLRRAAAWNPRHPGIARDLECLSGQARDAEPTNVVTLRAV